MSARRETRLSLGDKRLIQLEMLKEIDVFCRDNNIRYSLAYGTLIGAIRHKGFIPWDDDVDLIMPLPDMLRFKSIFKSDSISFCDVDTVEKYDLPFPRLSSKGTYQRVGLMTKTYGVNIDLYVMICLPNSEEIINSFFSKANSILKRRRRYKTIRKYMSYIFPIQPLPGFTKCMTQYHDFLLKEFPYTGTAPFFAVAGLPSWKEVYMFDFLDSLIDVEFEGLVLLATAHYDEWLTKEYGDYMSPPPEDQRHPYHGGRFYRVNNLW